jgi:hypothetical protein
MTSVRGNPGGVLQSYVMIRPRVRYRLDTFKLHRGSFTLSPWNPPFIAPPSTSTGKQGNCCMSPIPSCLSDYESFRRLQNGSPCFVRFLACKMAVHVLFHSPQYDDLEGNLEGLEETFGSLRCNGCRALVGLLGLGNGISS